MQNVREPYSAPLAVVGDLPKNGSTDHKDSCPEEAQEKRQHDLVFDYGVKYHTCGNGKRFWLQIEFFICQFMLMAAFLTTIKRRLGLCLGCCLFGVGVGVERGHKSLLETEIGYFVVHRIIKRLSVQLVSLCSLKWCAVFLCSLECTYLHLANSPFTHFSPWKKVTEALV